MTHLTIRPGGIRGGSLQVPGDKSVSHRALILSALVKGDTSIHGLLESDDCLATAAALRRLGVTVRKPQTCRGPFHVVSGRGIAGLEPPGTNIDCGNSGTTMRLLSGVLAGQPFESVLVGDRSLSNRPMRRVAEPLMQMGAFIETSEAGTPPLRVYGRHPLRAIKYVLPVPSAQVKSAILLAGLFANGTTHVVEPGVSRDHTERLLNAFGADIRCDGETVSLSPREMHSPGAIDVPGDLSSAAFLLVLGAIAPGCRVELEYVGINPTRDGILRLLKRMGAKIEIHNRHETRGGEPVADLVIESGALHAIDIDAHDVALAIDEIPVLLIAAACAQGTTTVRGAGELRVKESDRLETMAQGLRVLGIEIAEFEDGIAVTGGRIQGGAVDSAGDHRIAMAFAVAGSVAKGPVAISNTRNIATSWPNFVPQVRSLGLDISVERT